MLTRTLSWWIIFVLYILFFCIDTRLAHVGLCLIALGGMREFFSQMSNEFIPTKIRILAYIAIVFQFIVASQGSYSLTVATLPVLFLLVGSIWVLLFEDINLILKGFPLTFWTLFLISFGLGHLAVFLTMPLELNLLTRSGLLLYFIFITQFNDVLQFIWGSLFGKHPIAPSISPNKTWEGFVGGLISSPLLAYLISSVTPLSGYQSLTLGLLLSLTGFFGDLLMSAIKRNLKIKDMGRLIPGHGGILDRIDSLTLSSLTFFYTIMYWY